VEEDRDSTRPFRRPLLAAPARHRDRASQRDPFTQADFNPLRGNVHALLDEDRTTEAIRLIEDGLDRAGHDPAVALELRRLLAAALFYAGEYTRAAQLFDAAGRDYRRYLPPTDPYVLDCAYQAGHAYAEIGKPDKALPQLRFYVQNAPTADPDETAKVRESRFVIGQMLAIAGELDEAQIELEQIRPLLIEAFGPNSTQVSNLDKQIGRLKPMTEEG